MKKIRQFTIVRFNFAYWDYDIVCDFCGKDLNDKYHYRVFEDGHQIGDYPFHTRTCAKKYVARECMDSDEEEAKFDYIANGTKDYFQEEDTED